MTYQQKSWLSNETILPEHVNKWEQGIADSLKNDGSVVLTAEQKGVDAINDNGLTTLKQVKNLSTTSKGICNTPTYVNLTGSVSVINNSTTITGTSTLFTTECNVGDIILIAGINYVVATITNDTSLILTSVYTGATANGLTVKKATTEKDVSIDNFTLIDGTTIEITFTYPNASTNTLLLKTNTDKAYPIKNVYGNYVRYIPINTKLDFRYDDINKQWTLLDSGKIFNDAPDLTKGVNLSLNAPYTIIQDGWIFTTCHSDTQLGNSTCAVYVNGILTNQSNSGADGQSSSCWCRVCSGDVVTCNAPGWLYASRYYPYRG